MLFAIALAAASHVGRSITRPIDDLVRMATALGRGERVRRPKTGLAETTLAAIFSARDGSTSYFQI